jgi:hypothetical protein
MAAFVWHWGKRRPDQDPRGFQQQLAFHALHLSGLPGDSFRLISEYLGSSGIYTYMTGSSFNEDLVVVLKNRCEDLAEGRGQFNPRFAAYRDDDFVQNK